MNKRLTTAERARLRGMQTGHLTQKNKARLAHMSDTGRAYTSRASEPRGIEPDEVNYEIASGQE